MTILGSHTGHIQALGGAGDKNSGGGGGGGRILLLHARHDSIPHFRGSFDVWGGAPGTNAEAGASGTAYLKDDKRDFTFVFFLCFLKGMDIFSGEITVKIVFGPSEKGSTFKGKQIPRRGLVHRKPSRKSYKNYLWC